MTALLSAVERGILRGVIIMACAVGVSWAIEKLWGRG